MEDKTFTPQHIKPCLFCSNMAEFCNSTAFSDIGIKVYTCMNCRVRYLYFKDDILANYTIYTNINNKTFGWSICPAIKKAWLKFISNNDALEHLNGIPLFIEDQLRTFDNPPVITPQNIKEKISTYLIYL